MSVMGVREVVSSPEVFAAPTTFMPATVRECTDEPGFMSVAIATVAMGLTVVSLNLQPATDTSLRGATVGEVAYVDVHLRPTLGLSDALAEMRAFANQIGTRTDASPTLKALARTAVAAAEERRNEDIDEWAATIARDVADAND